MRTTITLSSLRPLPPSLHLHHLLHHHSHLPLFSPSLPPLSATPSPLTPLSHSSYNSQQTKDNHHSDIDKIIFDEPFEPTELKKRVHSPNAEVKQLEEDHFVNEGFNFDEPTESKQRVDSPNAEVKQLEGQSINERFNFDEPFEPTELKKRVDSPYTEVKQPESDSVNERFNFDEPTELKKRVDSPNVGVKQLEDHFDTENFNFDEPFEPPESKKRVDSVNVDEPYEPTELKKRVNSPYVEVKQLEEYFDTERFNFDEPLELSELKKRVDSPIVEVKQLDELPEQWRRSKLAWLCKVLPVNKPVVLTRVLNAQRKWLRQEDVTYVIIHCTRIRDNDTAFWVYKWMILQHWYRFDFALATKLAEYMGKERKYLKCRKIYDDIVNQGRVPSESTFHILTIAYLSSSDQGCLDEAFNIYNYMIQLGGYSPQLSLHNSLFKAIVSQPAGTSKRYLKQAEFIYHNLATSRLKIHDHIFGGLIWLHSYQGVIDKDRIAALRVEMRLRGVNEDKEVLLSILRACSKDGDLEEAEKTWSKLLKPDNTLPPKAYVYIMELYAKIGHPMKSYDIFRDLQEKLGSTSVVAYHKIIKILCQARKVELAESLMTEFINSGLKPLMPSFINLMDMYANLSFHDKLEVSFFQCLQMCRPNHDIYSLYLNSLVQIGNLDKAEEIFNDMHGEGGIGVNAGLCNLLLRGYLFKKENGKAKTLYDIMCKKKYGIESDLTEKLQYVLSQSLEDIKKPTSLQLSKEQRDMLIGMLLGGLPIESDEEGSKHAIHFKFNDNLVVHSVFKRHVHDQFYEWISFSDNKTSDQFSTISHTCFTFFANQFWPNGKSVVPKLIHRWLSPRVLAYWYMYGGYRTSSGDIILKVKGSKDGVERIVKVLKLMSLDCQVKHKGRVFWIGFLGNNATFFFKLVEPYILDELDFSED